jgi:hypothetical protein
MFLLLLFVENKNCGVGLSISHIIFGAYFREKFVNSFFLHYTGRASCHKLFAMCICWCYEVHFPVGSTCDTVDTQTHSDSVATSKAYFSYFLGMKVA